MAYDHAKRTTKNPSRPFGQGAYEGIVAPGDRQQRGGAAASTSRCSRSGIPGDAVTAVIIGALYIHGLKPGPMLMIETPHLFWFCVGNLFLANLLPAAVRPDRHQDLRQDRRDAEGDPAAADPDPVDGRHLRDREQPGARLLDAGHRRVRLLPQDVRLPGRPGHPRHHPGTADRRVVPPRDDLDRRRSAAVRRASSSPARCRSCCSPRSRITVLSQTALWGKLWGTGKRAGGYAE